MIKQKLIAKRKERNLTQEEFAYKLGLNTSNYNRRENGLTKISKKEWNLMAKILETTLYEIYEPDDGVYLYNNVSGIENNKYSTDLSNHSEFVFETMKKYIQKLEEENELLKKLINNQSTN